MKRIITIFFLSLSFVAFSQNPTGGPDAFGYTYTSSNATNGPTYQWFDISTTGSIVSGLSDDNFVGPFAINGFPYYSTTPTNLYIGSNGFISFNPVNIASSGGQFPAIPTVGGPNDFIAPMLTDLTFGGNSSNPAIAYFYNQGDTICVTFENVPFWVNNANQYAGDNAFQIILNKQDSSITFNYKKQQGLPDPVYIQNFVSIGIENGTGNDGLQYFRGDTFPGPNTTIRYDYPTIIQPVTDIEVSYINNDKNGAIFLSQNSPFVPITSIKNRGNQDVSTAITVNTNITDSSGFNVYNGTATIDSLAAGVDSLVQMTSFSPTTSGKFIVTSSISPVPNDASPSNDTKGYFFKVVDTSLTSQTLDYSTSVSGFGIGWAGGNGGCGVYIEPPYYPARVTDANFYITTLGTMGAGFHSIILDDNGRGPGQGTVLDSTFLQNSNIIIGQYNNVPVVNPITITNGGVYLYWLMSADGINLGRSFTTPASQRTYEIIFGAWSEYRDKTTEDFLMNIEIAPVTVSIEELKSQPQYINMYPNPATEKITASLKYDASDIIQVLDVTGKMINTKLLKAENTIEIYRGNLPAGNYFLRVGKKIQQFVWVD